MLAIHNHWALDEYNYLTLGFILEYVSKLVHTIQYNTIQYTTIQCNTMQCNTITTTTTTNINKITVFYYFSIKP